LKNMNQATCNLIIDITVKTASFHQFLGML